MFNLTTWYTDNIDLIYKSEKEGKEKISNHVNKYPVLLVEVGKARKGCNQFFVLKIDEKCTEGM